ncbi:MAG: DUF2157 domain-containing protein [Synergistaceae bacterium]|jgi:hypothetical protein|nr:DUF2157 domain-containing protein [Synergistaceae bacterium]
MERRVSEAKRRFLADESRDWVERGLISESQRGGILECYTVARRLPAIVLTLGVSMIGIGILCFIAANWRGIPDWLKIALIVGSYMASAGGAYGFETRGRRVASELSLFLSGFLLLGGLVLISQIFHIDGSASGLLATWLVVFAPAFLLVRGISIYVLYEIVAVIYINIIYAAFFDYRYRVRENPDLILGPWEPYLPLFLLVGLAWWTWWRARAVSGGGPGELDESNDSKIKVFFVGGSTRRVFLSNFLVLNWFTWMCVINSTHENLMPYVFGVLVIGALIGVMARWLDAADLDWQCLLFVGASGIALSFPWIWRTGDAYYRGGSYLAAPILSSVALGVWLVYRIVLRRRGGGFTVFLFCALLARWYFDMYHSFRSKSFFFVTGGILLLLVAFAYRRWNKIRDAREAAADDKREGGESDD